MIKIFISISLSSLLLLTGCAGKKKPVVTQKPLGQIQTPGQAGAGMANRGKQRIIKIADQEWDYFGRQTIRMDESGESIPHVGHWEDDGDPWSSRVNWYWRSVGKPGLDGFDCKEPWSAAFISWVMKQAGLSHGQFPGSDAHWSYVNYFVSRSGEPNGAFASHAISEYSPKPGDLICATRGTHGFIPVYGEDPAAVLRSHAKLHCDIVVEKRGNTLQSIGGNVRNSVSKTQLPLGPNGLLKPSERRPWFVVLENRLGQ
ncbi:MAG: hypothetical protein RLZZ09_944 [Pseudomonadota bacterium]|jgi:hypothetical protein